MSRADEILSLVNQRPIPVAASWALSSRTNTERRRFARGNTFSEDGQYFRGAGCYSCYRLSACLGRGQGWGIFPAIILFSASAHAICSELGTVNFCFKWRHRDGSTVEFKPTGWTSDDPLKADWLSKTNQLYSSPGIPPGIRNWLQEECESHRGEWSQSLEPTAPFYS